MVYWLMVSYCFSKPVKICNFKKNIITILKLKLNLYKSVDVANGETECVWDDGGLIEGEDWFCGSLINN